MCCFFRFECGPGYPDKYRWDYWRHFSPRDTGRRLGFSHCSGAFFKGFRRFGDFLIGIRPKRAEIGALGFGKDRRAKLGVLEDPQDVLPKPRLRRNSIDAVLKEDPSVAKDAQPEQPPRDVVVNRPVALASTEKGGQVRRVIKKPKAAKVADAVVAPYERPDLSLLTRGEAAVESEDDEELRQKSMQIEAKLKDFGILGRVTHIHPGPVITLFEFEPAPGVKVGRIAALQDDLAMGLRASSIRIIAPIPKRGTVGIEVPNRHRDLVRLRDVLESDACANADSILSVPIGKDTSGEAVVADISTMPHLLMAGATGTGKSVSINAFIISFLYRADPSELGLILIDPKILELSAYEGIPHLRVPVVTHPKQARAVLQWAINEMERRYRLLQRFSVRNIDGYNRIVAGDAESEGLIREPGEEAIIPGLIPLKENDIVQSGTVDPDEVMTGPLDPQELLIAEELKPLPKIVIVIDELADLMLTVGRDIEELITRLAQKARASGIHLILATQRPSVDVITGLIKANFPARLSFRVTSKIDSRTILDSGGAEKLLGRGDMLLMQPGADGLRRVHGAFVSDAEVKKVVAAVKKGGTPRYDEHIMHLCEKALAEDDGENSSGVTSDGTIDPSEYDSFYDKAVELVVEKGQASTSMIQRTFRIGYNRAARIIEMMEREGVIGPMDGVKPRQVIVPTHDQE